LGKPNVAKKFWLNNDPVESHFYNAFSLTFPEGELFFIESVRHFEKSCPDKLRAEVKNFIGQESYHMREHGRFNKHMDPSVYPLKDIAERVKAVLKVAKARGPDICLMATAMMEHITAIMADDFLKNPQLFDGVDEDTKKLWLWHALEEAEHKGVAYDVWLETRKNKNNLISYLIRLRSFIIASNIFMINLTWITIKLLRADGFKGISPWIMYFQYLVNPRGLWRRHWKAYFRWLKPNFHPWEIQNQNLILQWRKNLNLEN
jgi:predicted metal-dependent hydrolase